jgi:hypothetical protein
VKGEETGFRDVEAGQFGERRD